MNTFVTGSTGLLGINLVQALLSQGHSVKALARSKAKAEKFLPKHPRLEVVEGDMENVLGFASHLQGSDWLFHTAAYFRESFGNGDHWPMLEKINVKATLELFEAAEKQGVNKVIHVSSTAAIALLKDRAGTEEDMEVPEKADSPYAKSKIVGDRAIDEFSKTHTIPIVTVHPSWMLGPNDAAPTAGGQFVIDHLQQKLPGVLADSGIEVVDVRDVVEVMLRAADKAPGGSHYIATNVLVSQAEICATIEKVSGVPAPSRRLPNALVFTIAWISERISAMTGRTSSVTVGGVKSITVKKRASSAKAQRELGVTFRPLEDTMRDAVNSFRENGYVSKSTPATTVSQPKTT